MAKKEDRLLNPKPFKHYRNTYARAEVRWGALVLVGLAAITAWVVWKGANPDPSLFPDEIPTLKRRGLEAGDDKGRTAGLSVGEGAAKAEAVDRGPVPADLAPAGWRERNLSAFDNDNLYVKINGRAGYFQSFGFQRLVFLTLEDEADSTRAIDVEAYTLADAPNALGCFAGETPEDAAPEVLEDGLVRLDQNALYVARGPHYIRLIAGDASPETQAVLRALREKLLGSLKGEPLPWSYALFLALGAKPAKIAVVPENAFSFDFARDVHKAELGGDLEAFAVAREDAADAKQLAAKFVAGWMSYGEKSGPWVKDRYLNQLSGARAEGRYVIGLRGAEDAAQAEATIARLAAAVRALPDDAAPAAPEAPAPAPTPADDYEEEGEKVEDTGQEEEGEAEGGATEPIDEE